MVPYQSTITLSVASPGAYLSDECDGLFGRMRSREGAKLKYVINDIEKVGRPSPSSESYHGDNLIYEQLVSPTVGNFQESISKSLARLEDQECTPGKKNAFYLVYAGHGRNSDGALELGDGAISGKEFYEFLASNYKSYINTLHLNIILDSCYSGRFLIDLIVSCQNDDRIYPFDCNVSSLPDEKSYEMDFLEHGAFSYTLTHIGNSYVNVVELARAVDTQDYKTIYKNLQGVTIPNSVAFLTCGRQHSMELVSGHYLSIPGAGSIELQEHLGELTHLGLAEAVRNAQSNYGGDTDYEN